MRARIEAALRELPLTDARVAAVADRIPDSILLRDGFITRPDSGFFDFRRKVAAVAEGLTAGVYLKAAGRQPALFYMRPETVIANIEGVLGRFNADGLTAREYLRAALKQPQLFCQTPATITSHLLQIIDLHRQGLVAVPGQDDPPSGLPLRPLFDWLECHPRLLTLGGDNFAVREIAARADLTKPRGAVEAGLAAALGHPDPAGPVPKEPTPADGGEPGRHARNLLLRAVIRDGLVKRTLGR